MHMTESEIVCRYKRSARKPGNIRILAELNSCDTSEIKEILRAGGIPEEELDPKKKNCPEKKKRNSNGNN